MTADLSKLTACVIDTGLGCDFASALAPKFERMFYFNPWVSSFPHRHLAEVGNGLDGVTRIVDLDEYEDEIDLFIFLDVNFGALQERLRKAGKKVWGSFSGEDLELYRWDSKEYQKQAGLPVPKMTLIHGMDALEVFLRDNKGPLFVKISKFRGIGETRRHDSWDSTKTWFQKTKHELGPLANRQDFIIEWAVETDGEYGYDGWTIHGFFPRMSAYGFEGKDKIYVGTVMPYDQLPEPVRKVNAGLVPAFSGYQYQGFYSSEIRGDVLIDSTCRLPSPPGALYPLWFSNMAEVIWAGANGQILDPVPTAKYACELILYSEAAANDWLNVQFPERIEKFVALYNHYYDGEHWVVPTDAKLVQIGGVMGLGDTIESAMTQALEHADLVKGDGIDIKRESIPAILDTIRESVEQGVPFGDSPIPDKVEI